MNMKSAALAGIKPRQKDSELKRHRKTSKKCKNIAKNDEASIVIEARHKYIDARHVKKAEAGHLLGCLFLNGDLEHRQ